MRRFLFVAALVAVQSPASAQDGAACSKVADPDDRLFCYDQVFKDIKTAPASEGSAWDVREETSKIDDSKSVYLTVVSSDTIADKYGREARGRLWLRCLENTTSAIIEMPGFFLSDNQGFGKVTVRIDDRKAIDVRMAAATNHSALGLWDGRSAIPFIEGIGDGGSMLVRVTPYSDSPVTMTFPIAGLPEHLPKLKAACGW